MICHDSLGAPLAGVVPALLGLLVASSSLPAQDAWPMYQGNASHDGYLPITIEPSSLRGLWSVPASPSGLTACTAAGGKVFFSSYDKKVRAVSAATGAELWSADFSRAFSVNPPSFAHGNVYVQTCNHASDTWLHALDAATGATVFRAPHLAQWEQYEAPTVLGNTVYVNGGSYGGAYAFDALDGRQRWFTPLAQYDEWTPAVDANLAYAYVGGTVTAMDRATGQTVFAITDYNFSWAGWSMATSPVLGGQEDLFVVHGGRLLRFDLLQQSISYELNGNYREQPVVARGVVYVMTGSDVEARDQRTGALLWSWTSPSTNLSADLLITNEHMLVGDAGNTWLVDLGTRQVAWQLNEGGQFTVAEGVLYITQSNGQLTAVQFTELPAPLDVSPDRLHYTASPVTVTVHGNGFAKASNVEVLFGSAAAGNVSVVDNHTITCTSPVLGPGVVDVRVRNDNGERALADGFAYIPALQVGGSFQPGGEIVVRHEISIGDTLVAVLGVPPQVAVSIPGYAGQLGVSQPYPLLLVPPALFDSFTYRLPIPNLPAVRGAQLLFQGLAGRMLIGPTATAAWTNIESVTIQ